MKIHDIETWNGARQFEYYVSCFERRMVLIFRDFEDYSNKELFDNLEDSYYKWLEDAECQCCEETLIDKLPKIYKDNLMCVIYENDDEESEE